MVRANKLKHGRSAVAALGTLALGAAVLLAGCGSQGYAAPLEKTSTVAWQGVVAGSATLTPEYATHVEVFFPSSTAIPYANASTPAELRLTNCTGKFLTTLGDTTPTTDAAGNAQLAHPLHVAQDAAGGWDVSVPQSDKLYVAVLAHQNASSTNLVGCGHPLSARRQYFDLYPPSIGSNGSGLGIVKMEPISGTRIAVSLNAPHSSRTTWALREGSCSGRELASGTLAAGATTGDGYVFSAPASSWYMTVQGRSGKSACQKS